MIDEVAEVLSHVHLPELAAKLWISAGASDFTFFRKASRPSQGPTRQGPTRHWPRPPSASEGMGIKKRW